MDNEKLESLLNDFIERSRSIENSIMSSLTDANSDIEMVLRELLVYLNSTSKFLDEIQEKIELFNQKTTRLDSIPSKLDYMDDKIDVISPNNQQHINEQTKKIFGALKKITENNNKFLNLILTHIQGLKEDRKLLNKIVETLYEINTKIDKDYEETQKTHKDVSKSQEHLMHIINNFMNMSKESNQQTVEIQKSEHEIRIEKIKLYGKLLGLILGSGGILYLVVSSLLGG